MLCVQGKAHASARKRKKHIHHDMCGDNRRSRSKQSFFLSFVFLISCLFYEPFTGKALPSLLSLGPSMFCNGLPSCSLIFAVISTSSPSFLSRFFSTGFLPGRLAKLPILSAQGLPHPLSSSRRWLGTLRGDFHPLLNTSPSWSSAMTFFPTFLPVFSFSLHTGVPPAIFLFRRRPSLSFASYLLASLFASSSFFLLLSRFYKRKSLLSFWRKTSCFRRVWAD